MGHRHDRGEILDAAVAVAVDEGLAKLSFARVARRVGTSDRVVVYYFPSKTDLVGEVLAEVGTRLQMTLAPALSAAARDHLEVVRRAWPVLASPEADPVFALFFEAAGYAAAGHEPYRSLVPPLVDAWIEWVATLLDGPARTRRREAAAAVAALDGLLLLRQLCGPVVADAAARGLVGRSPAGRSAVRTTVAP
jgi:AcrR family transcriptional regulator